MNERKKINIVLPALNEEAVLERNVLKILDYLSQSGLVVNNDWQVIIVDNKSTDKTAEIGKRLAVEHPQVKYLYIPERGKGIAIKKGWESLAADYYCFMDVDLATDLSSLSLLVAGMQDGYGVVVGSRYVAGSEVDRTLGRRFASKVYQTILKLFLHLSVKDAPCGFKMISREVVEKVLPQVQSRTWFFDTELLVLASRAGFRIKEVPVKWVEFGERKSRVNFWKVAWEYLWEIGRLRGRIKRNKSHETNNKISSQ